MKTIKPDWKVLLNEEQERENLPSKLVKFKEKCLEKEEDSDHRFYQLLKIWDVTSEVLWAYGYWQHYLRCGDIALTCASKLKKLDIEGRILNELGWAQMEQGKFKIALRCFSNSLEIFQTINDYMGQGQSLRYMGVLHFRRSSFGLAMKCYQEALNKAQEGLKLDPLNQRLLHQQSEIHNLLGNLYLNLWNVQTCRRELIASLKGFRQLQKLYISPTPSSYIYFQPAPLLNLGRVAMQRRQYSKAKHYFNRCYQLCERINRPDAMAGALLRLAELARVQGRLEEANQLAKRAKDISEKEVPLLGSRAAVLLAQMQGDRRQQLKAKFYQIKRLATLIADLIIHAPLVLLHFIANYTHFSLYNHLRLK